MTDRVKQWIRPEILALDAYHVAPAGNMVKLDAMENPYHWPQSMVDEWLEILRDVHVNRYPDPIAAELKEELKEEANSSWNFAPEATVGRRSTQTAKATF